MRSQPWIAYVGGSFMFPSGDAGGRRVLGNALTLSSLGYLVRVAPSLNGLNHRGLLPRANIHWQGLGEYDSAASPIRKMSWQLWSCGEATIRWLHQQADKPAAVIVYGSLRPLLSKLTRWCRRNAVPLLCDLVEWYDGSHMTGGRFGPFHFANEYTMRRLIPSCDGIIAISEYLQNYYGQRGLKTLRVPPTLDVQAVSPSLGPHATDRLNLLYAGIPGKKDLLNHILRAIASVDPSGSRMRLLIIGPDERTVEQLFPVYPQDAVEIVGRRSHEQVLKSVAKADFTVLLRRNERYARAGFSTKVVESLSCGTPVMCNLTGDLHLYIREGETGLVCRDESCDAFADVLRRALLITTEQRRRMRESSRAEAERAFDYRAFAEPMREFLEQVGIVGASAGI